MTIKIYTSMKKNRLKIFYSFYDGRGWIPVEKKSEIPSKFKGPAYPGGPKMLVKKHWVNHNSLNDVGRTFFHTRYEPTKRLIERIRHSIYLNK